MTSSSTLTAPTTSANSEPANTEKASSQATRDLIDGVFYIEKQRWGTYVSYMADGKELVTGLDPETVERMTRFYLKGKQEGWSDSNTKTYDSYVGGKL